MLYAMKLASHQVSGIGLMIIASMIIMSACNSLSSNNWPQFRGPDVNMIAINENLPVEWGMI
jgi:hypothetical protein